MAYKFRSLLLALITLISVAQVFRLAMIQLEGREGIEFIDPLFTFWGPHSLHLPIFLSTYLPLVRGITWILCIPGKREDLIYGYCILQILRMVTIYFVPLEPPSDMIVLQDPIADHLVFGTVITKDLFFSGHVSTLVLFGLYWPSSRGKYLYFSIAIVDALLLTAQHVHYSIDVIAAPFFAYLAYVIQNFLSRKFALRSR